MGDRDEVGVYRKVVVPEVVMNGLEVPDALAGLCVQRDGAVGEEVVPLAIAAIEIEIRRSQARENHPPLLIDTQSAPGIGPAPLLPGVRLPGLRTEFSRPGNRMKPPR